MPGPVRDKKGEAYQQLEAILLRQMLQSSGAFKAGSTPGAQLRTDMFVETLADAVAKAGGLGIARMLERQLGGGAGQDPRGVADPKGQKPIPGLHLLPLSSSQPASMSAVTSPAPLGAYGRSPLLPISSRASYRAFAHPNPSSSSSDPASAISPTPSWPPASSAGAAIGDSLEDPNNDAPLPEDPTAGSIDDYQPRQAHRRAISLGRALNRYRGRAEATVGSTPTSALGGGDEP